MIFNRIFGNRKGSDAPPEVRAVFERVRRFLESDSEQLALYPAELRRGIETGLDVDRLPNSSGPFGQVIENPIPVNGPIGQVIYLSTLRCNGSRVLFHRLGSIDRVDVFECVSADGREWDLLYLEMYHPKKSTLVPTGYTKESNALLSGIHKSIKEFPIGLYEEIIDLSKGLIGFSLADPEIRKSLEAIDFKRPSGHVSRLSKISLHGRTT
jgi:hypothetical protein